MARVVDRIERIVGDRLIASDIIRVKSELTTVQRMLSKGELREAMNKILEIGNTIEYIVRSVDDEDILADIYLADWHLQRALIKIHSKLNKLGR